MEFIIEGIKKGVGLILTLDPHVVEILKLSLIVSLLSTVIAVAVGIPAGSLIAVKKFPLKKLLIATINTGMGLPPVVVGLVISLFLFRNGPLGFLEWLYTVQGMILAQVIIAVPVITGLTLAAFQNIDKKLYLQIVSLGASTRQAVILLLKEIRRPILAAIIAGFGSVISEVGAVMMVGGNIKGQTRVLTTAIVLETHMGYFDTAIALGLILLSISFIINLSLTYIQQHQPSK